MSFPNTPSPVPSPFEQPPQGPGGPPPPESGQVHPPAIEPIRPAGGLHARPEAHSAAESGPPALPAGHIGRAFLAKLQAADSGDPEGGAGAESDRDPSTTPASHPVETAPANPGAPEPLAPIEQTLPEAPAAGAEPPTHSEVTATDAAPEAPEIDPSTMWDFQDALHDLQPHATKHDVAEITVEYPDTTYPNSAIPLTVSCSETWTEEPDARGDDSVESDLTFSIGHRDVLGPLSSWLDRARIPTTTERHTVERYVDMGSGSPENVWLREAYGGFNDTNLLEPSRYGGAMVGRLIENSPHPVNRHTEYELRAQFNNGSSITAEWNTEADDTPALLPADNRTHNRADVTIRTADGTLYQYFAEGSRGDYWAGPESAYEMDELPEHKPCTTAQLAEITQHLQAAVQSGIKRPPQPEQEQPPTD